MGKKLNKKGDIKLHKLCSEVTEIEDDIYEILLDKGMYPYGVGLAMNYHFLDTKWKESKNYYGEGYWNNYDYKAVLLNIFFEGSKNISKEIYVNVLIFSNEIADPLDSSLIMEFKPYELREKITSIRHDLEKDKKSVEFFDIVNKRFLEYQNGNGLKEMVVNYKRPSKDPFFS